MDAILNVNLDFFTQPYYYGNRIIEDDNRSYSDFYASAKNWLDTKLWIEKMGLTNRIRGGSVREENQTIYFWNKAIKDKLIEPKKFTIINFSSHHNMYLKYNENYYKSLELKYHNFDYMLYPYIQEMVDETIWVIPDYFTNDDISFHFKNIQIKEKISYYEIGISLNYRIRLKIIKWSDFVSKDYLFKYFTFILNFKTAKVDSIMIDDLSKYILKI